MARPPGSSQNNSYYGPQHIMSPVEYVEVATLAISKAGGSLAA